MAIIPIWVKGSPLKVGPAPKKVLAILQTDSFNTLMLFLNVNVMVTPLASNRTAPASQDGLSSRMPQLNWESCDMPTTVNL
jgi:hypothetical protein